MTHRAPVKPSDFPFGQIHEFLVSFCASGGVPDDLQLLIEDRALMKRVLDYSRCGGYEATPSQKIARRIMGQNFLGLEEVAEHLKIRFSEKDRKALAEIPYSESVLEAVKDTHILTAYYSLSIIEIRARATQGTFNPDNTWYNDKKEKFAYEKCPLGWLLIRKTEVPNSAGKSYNDQLTLLSPEEVVPSAVEVVYAMTLYFLARGEKLFQTIWVRTSSLSSYGGRVIVSFYDGGLNISIWVVDGRNGFLGLASSRKFQKSI